MALNQSARWREVFRRSQGQSGAVFERDDALHQPFSKTGLSYYEGRVVILNRASHNLRSRGREVIDQNYQRRPVGIGVARSVLVIVHAVSALLTQNQLSGRQKSFSYVNRLFKKSARIVPQIKHERVHAARMQEVQR